MIRQCKRCGCNFVPKVSTQETCPYRCRPPKKQQVEIRKARREERTIITSQSKRTPTKDRNKLNRYYQLTYGITIDDFDKRVVTQDGRCAICGAIADLVIDHDHKTGDIRGLLCLPCNSGLGHFHDSTGAMRAAITYIEKSRKQ